MGAGLHFRGFIEECEELSSFWNQQDPTDYRPRVIRFKHACIYDVFLKLQIPDWRRVVITLVIDAPADRAVMSLSLSGCQAVKLPVDILNTQDPQCNKSSIPNWETQKGWNLWKMFSLKKRQSWTFASTNKKSFVNRLSRVREDRERGSNCSLDCHLVEG